MENVKLLNIHERILLARPDALRFGEDYFLFDAARPSVLERPFKMDTYGFFLCQRGTARGTVDLMPYELRPGMLAVNVPEQLITHTYSSDDFCGINLSMTQRFVNSLGLPYNFSLAIGVRENPILTLKPGERRALENYCAMVRGLLEKERPYQVETLRHLTCAYAYSLGAYLYRMAESRHLSGDELLMQRFLAEVRAHYKEERRVIFYAERLHLTAGYLASLVRRVSGKTPSDWIDEFIVLEAKVLLKSSGLTIQQISDKLHFPSQSFFGKYFKRLTGISPKGYREK